MHAVTSRRRTILVGLTIATMGLLSVACGDDADDSSAQTSTTTAAGSASSAPQGTSGGGGTGSATETSEQASEAGQVTLTAASYDKAFDLQSCSLNGDVMNLTLSAEADGMTLEVEAVEGVGVLKVDGGTEQDGITLNGDVEEVEADGRDFTARGTFGEPNNVGEEFTLTGTCPE